MKNIFVQNNEDGTQSVKSWAHLIVGCAFAVSAISGGSILFAALAAAALAVKKYWGPAGFIVVGIACGFCILATGLYVMVLERRIKRSNSVVEKLNEARRREEIQKAYSSATSGTSYYGTATPLIGGGTLPPIV